LGKLFCVVGGRDGVVARRASERLREGRGGEMVEGEGGEERLRTVVQRLVAEGEREERGGAR
jgi:hypothetical protein